MPRLTDGFSTTIDFDLFPNVDFFEISVKPVGIDGGGENDTTTMRNIEWRTRQPKKLKTLTEGTFSAAYRSEVYDTIVAMVNVVQEMTVTFPDGSTLTFLGWLNSFEPSELVEGEQPTADVTFMASNQTTLGVETPPVYVP